MSVSLYSVFIGLYICIIVLRIGAILLFCFVSVMLCSGVGSYFILYFGVFAVCPFIFVDSAFLVILIASEFVVALCVLYFCFSSRVVLIYSFWLCS